MKRVFLTGGTGFVGGHVAQTLTEAGYAVRALVRPGQRLRAQHPNIECVTGDVRDRASLDAGMAGCDAVVHAAAIYTFWSREPGIHYEVNVDGSRNVFLAAQAAGVGRVVYTSTVATIRDASQGLPNEDDFAEPSSLVGAYKRSKWEAERIALRMAEAGAPIVIVNPTAPIGPGDVKPTPTGGIILDFLRRKMPAYVDTGLNLVDVRDVATGHLLALEKGVPGRRYLLGNAEGNLTLERVLRMLGELTGLKPPGLKLPHRLVRIAARVDTFVEGSVLRRHPRIPLEAVRIAAKKMWVDPSRSIHDLGFPQRPVREALRDAAAWFLDNGYVTDETLSLRLKESIGAANQ